MRGSPGSRRSTPRSPTNSMTSSAESSRARIPVPVRWPRSSATSTPGTRSCCATSIARPWPRTRLCSSSHHAASRKQPGCRPRGRTPSGADPGRPRARARTKCRRLWCASASPAPAPAVWLPEWSGTRRDATRIGCRCGKPRAFPSPRRSSTTPLRSGTSGSPSRPTPSTRSTPRTNTT